MANYVEVRLIRVICHDKESSSAEHDVFALTGAVVVDGQTYPFAHPAVPLKTGWTFSYQMPLFAGWVHQPSIGIGALGMDLDNSDGWVKSEDDVRKVTKAVAKAASYLPVQYIDSVIEHIPDAIDFFAGLDEDDEVFRWAEDIPLERLAPGQTETKIIAPRVRGEKSALISISDWDYALEFGVTWQEPYPAFPPTKPTSWSTQPDTDTMPAAWLGGWESVSGGIECWITRSAGSSWHLDVHTKERLPNGEVREFDTLGAAVAGISPVALRLGGAGAAVDDAPAPGAGDRIQLANGCVLEMRRVFADGVEIDDRVIRYAGPGRVSDVLDAPSIDIDLERPIHVG